MADENVSGGLSDFFKLGFDKSKIDLVKIEGGSGTVLDGIEPAVTSPGNVDAWAFKALKDAVHSALANLKHEINPSGPLVVGAHKPHHTKEEVEAEIIKQGADPKKFAPLLLLLLQFAPMLFEIIKKLLGK